MPRLENALANLPLSFIKNEGQLDRGVSYHVQGADTSLFFTSSGVTFALDDERESSTEDGSDALKPFERPTDEEPGPHLLRLDFVGADVRARPVGVEKASGVVSYFTGPQSEWKTGLPTYSQIVYRDLWPGIDLVYSGTASSLKYSFLVDAGADPGQITLAYRGSAGLEVNGSGQLEIRTPRGIMVDDAPYSYQKGPRGRIDVATSYALRGSTGEQAYGFDVGRYDPSRPLVIDPAVFVYSGYIGGASDEGGHGIAVDPDGNAYITGRTTSTAPTFPERVGPDLSYNGGTTGEYGDAFVAKVDAGGSLVYAGYIGGGGIDGGTGIAVGPDGAAYVAGWTTSSATTFPDKVGPDLSFNGADDVFVAKVSPSGTSLDYAGYIGGAESEWAMQYPPDIAVDLAGAAYVTGFTRSPAATFPEKGGPDLTFNGGSADGAGGDAFIAKVAPSGEDLVYAGYLGGSGHDYGAGVEVDGAGNAYVAGTTTSTQATFPEKAGPDLTYNGGSDDAFLAKVSAGGSSLVYAGYVGGNAGDASRDIAVGADGAAYVTGHTNSNQATFPDKAGPDLTYNGGWDAFIAKVAASGKALAYAGYLGGSSTGLNIDDGLGVAVDANGAAYVAGRTDSPPASFPEKGGPDSTFGGGRFDGFVAKVKSTGAGLVYAGYVGGSGLDTALGIDVDAMGNAYLTGHVESRIGFPTKVGPDLTHNGGADGFVAKVGWSY